MTTFLGILLILAGAFLFFLGAIDILGIFSGVPQIVAAVMVVCGIVLFRKHNHGKREYDSTRTSPDPDRWMNDDFDGDDGGSDSGDDGDD